MPHIDIRSQKFYIFPGGNDVTLGLGVAKDTFTLNWLDRYRKIGKLPRLILVFILLDLVAILILDLVVILLMILLVVVLFLVAVH